jgi:hypothetical protein
MVKIGLILIIVFLIIIVIGLIIPNIIMLNIGTVGYIILFLLLFGEIIFINPEKYI